MSDEGWINVKVRFAGERRWYFLSNGGRVSRLRIHAATVESIDQAKAIAADVISYDDDNVVASRVDVDGRTVARYGEKTPPLPAKATYGPAGGYHYLVGVTATGMPVFHVLANGQWATMTADIYEVCYREAKNAGLPTTRLHVYGSSARIATHGLVFHQRWERRVA